MGDLVRKSAIEPYLAHKVQPLNFHLVRSPPRSAGFGGLFPPGVRDMSGNHGHLSHLSTSGAAVSPWRTCPPPDRGRGRGPSEASSAQRDEDNDGRGRKERSNWSSARGNWRPRHPCALSRAYVGTIIAANRAAFVRAAGPGGRAHPRARAGGRCPSIASSSEARTKIAMEGAGRSRRRLEFRKGRCLNEDN